LILAALAVLVWAAPYATAGFLASTSPSVGTVTTASLAAPTGTGVTETACTNNSAPSQRTTVTWTAAPVPTTGYAILRATASGGPFIQIGTAAGGTTTSYVDATGQLAFQTTYYYVVRSTLLSWSSGNSAAASVTTFRLNCR
jgi:hypothetical protein